MKPKKMKTHTRGTACLLAVLLAALAACGGNGAGADTGGGSAQGALGRYVETDVTPPSVEAFRSFVTADGAIVCFDSGLKNRYESTDMGETWTTAPGPGAAGDRYTDVSQGCLLPNGDLLLWLDGEGFVRAPADGSSNPVAVGSIDQALSEGKQIMLNTLLALSGTRVLIAYTSGTSDAVSPDMAGGELSVSDSEAPVLSATPVSPGKVSSGTSGSPEGGGNVSGGDGAGGRTQTVSNGAVSFSIGESVKGIFDLETGELARDLSDWDGSSAASDREFLYLAYGDGDVEVLNIADGSIVAGQDRTIPANGANGQNIGGGNISDGPMMRNAGTLAVSEGGDLLMLSGGDIIVIREDGESETLLQGTRYAFGDPNSAVQSLDCLPDGSIVANIDGSALYRYQWDANATDDATQTLSVWSLEDNNFVRAAISAFRKTHPDAVVQYDAVLAEDTAMSADDAIKSLNTRMLNGDGPDIVILDETPMESYSRQGMLADLSGLLDTGDVFGEILSSFETEGGLRYLPTQFRAPLLAGAPEDLGRAGTLEGLIEMVESLPVLPEAGPPSIGAPTGADEEARSALGFVDTPSLFDILWEASAPAVISNDALNTVKLSDFLTAMKKVSDRYGLSEEKDESRQSMMMAVGIGGGDVVQVGDPLVNYLSRLSRLGAVEASGMMYLHMVAENQDGAGFASFPGLADGAYRPCSVAGVSADSERLELAAAFVQEMLDPAVQGALTSTGFPVTRTGAENQASAIQKMTEETGRVPAALDFASIVGLLKEPVLTDAVPTAIIREASIAFCEGETDLDGAVAAVEQSLKNYLAERA